MFTHSRRPMSDDERDLLIAERDEHLRRLRPFDPRLWLALVAAGIFAALAPLMGPLGWVLAALFAAIGIPGVYLSYSGRKLANTLRRESDEMLAAGEVESRRVEATAVAEIREIGNFAAWVFEISPSQLYLHPSHLAPEDEDTPFPSTTFELVSTTDGDPLTIHATGHLLTPARVIDKLDLDPRDLPWLDTFPGTIADTEDALRRQAALKHPPDS